jgi:RNA polymerase sigma factor (sigma-70 family)
LSNVGGRFRLERKAGFLARFDLGAPVSDLSPRPDLAEMRDRLARVASAFILLGRRFLLRRGLQAADADDLVQTALADAAAALPACHAHSDRQLLGWLRGILRHRRADFLRASGRRSGHEIPLAADLADAASPDLGAAETGELSAALAHLSEMQHSVLLAYFYHGRSLAAIGKSLDMTADAVRMMKARALARLRELLGGGRTFNPAGGFPAVAPAPIRSIRPGSVVTSPEQSSRTRARCPAARPLLTPSRLPFADEQESPSRAQAVANLRLEAGRFLLIG